MRAPNLSGPGVMVKLAALLSLGGCQGEVDFTRAGGSSTVYPILEASAEELLHDGGIRATVSSSGTGGGLRKLCDREIELAGASRPMKESEIGRCQRNGVRFIEIPVAYDGIVVAVNPAADFVDSMTIDELRLLWSPEAQNVITRWSQVRPGWPDEPIRLYGAGVDSGTYDYFTRAVVGTEHASRGDYVSSEDDNVLVDGVASDPWALGFFGYAYYAASGGTLKAVAIDDGEPANGARPVLPTPETVAAGEYQPLSRPLLVYVRADAREVEDVRRWVDALLDPGGELVEAVGYIPLPPGALELAHERFDKGITGSVFEGGSAVGMTVEALLQRSISGGGS